MNSTSVPTLSERILIRSAWVSLWVSVIVLALKFYGYAITHSQSILSDGLESVVNVLTAVVALFVMRAVAEPADKEHPYGHGKLEFFSAAFEGGFIVFAALVIFYSTIQAFVTGALASDLLQGISYMILASAFNLATSVFLFRVSAKHQSEALRASARHLLLDVFTTAGVVVGLLVAHFLKLPWLDNVIAVLVAIHILREGMAIVRRSAGALIDETDVSLVGSLTRVMEKHRFEGFIDIHNVKIIRSGRFHHIDADLVLPEFWSIDEAHIHAEAFEKAVLTDYPFNGEMALHMDPCKREYCRQCNMQNCPVRQQPFVSLRKLQISDVSGPHG